LFQSQPSNFSGLASNIFIVIGEEEKERKEERGYDDEMLRQQLRKDEKETGRWMI
jgi:hypothetical protein